MSHLAASWNKIDEIYNYNKKDEIYNYNKIDEIYNYNKIDEIYNFFPIKVCKKSPCYNPFTTFSDLKRFLNGLKALKAISGFLPEESLAFYYSFTEKLKRRR